VNQESKSSITNSNQSSQSSTKGNSQTMPQAIGPKNSVVSGAGSSAPRKVNGKVGKPSFR